MVTCPHLLCSKQGLGGASAALLQNSMQVPGRVASAVGHNPRRLLQSYSPRLAEGLLMTVEVSRVPQDFYMIWSACLVHNWPGGTFSEFSCILLNLNDKAITGQISISFGLSWHSQFLMATLTWASSW